MTAEPIRLASGEPGNRWGTTMFTERFPNDQHDAHALRDHLGNLGNLSHAPHVRVRVRRHMHTHDMYVSGCRFLTYGGESRFLRFPNPIDRSAHNGLLAWGTSPEVPRFPRVPRFPTMGAA
jgi:hypothetical protein